MTRPSPSGKKAVNLASSAASKPAPAGPRVSRIRRDPPPRVRETVVVVDTEEREQWAVIVGILAFALAIFVLVLAFGIYSAWSPREYAVEVRSEG